MTKRQLQKIVKKLADLSFKDGRILELQVTRSIKALKSLPRFQAIASLGEYLKSIKRMERQFTMYIETAIPLPEMTVKKMRKIVEKKSRITRVVTNINPEILGGFKLRVGDEVWDETILGKIKQVKEVIHG